MNPRDSEKLAAGLRALAASMEAQSPPTELETALRLEFRRRKSRRRIWTVSATLAAGVIIGALFVPRGERPGLKSPAPSQPAPVAVVTRRPAPEPARTVAKLPKPVRRAASAPRRQEVMTDFFPVAGGDLLSPLDRGGVIRVQLPRSALMVFGLPMNEARAAEAVKADVLVGEDGLARAIRFVQ